MKHYFARITENNGGMEYDTPFLFVIKGDPHKYARKIAKDWRGSDASDWDNALGGYWSDHTTICVDSYQEIPEADFEVLKKYLAVL